MAVVEDTTLEDRLESLIAPSVASIGFSLVRVKMFNRRGRILQVMIERADGDSATIDDCAMVSRLVSAHLDAEDPVSGAYDLEVSSTGIDRPLVRREDFSRFAGFEATASIDPPLDGRRRFQGRLAGMADDNVQMEQSPGSIVSLPFASIVDAKLVLNDELIRETAQPVGEPAGAEAG
ncbi:MAG: ribosome maturation factor RimP [bacterium]|nr:ribosome maturation factor RimP [bacterium]